MGPINLPFTAQEMGFPGPQVRTPSSMPPGDGGSSVPHFLTFSGLVQTVSHAYLYTYDEALRNSTVNAKAMRNDPVLMGALRRRQRPTSQLTWHISPQDDSNPAESEAAKFITDIINEIPSFQKLKMYALEAIWYGHYGVEIGYGYERFKGRNTLMVRDHDPINGDKIRFQWNTTPGILVYAGYPGEKSTTDYGYVHWLTPTERRQYIIHEHEPDDADWSEPEMGGAIHGVGVRGRCYWFWWLKQQVFGLLMDYLHRFANGLTVFYYDASNPEAKLKAEESARQQFTRTALAYPRWNNDRPDKNSVERIEVSTASPMLLWNLAGEYFDNIMERYTEGQTLSSNTDATGLGSGVADQHGQTLDEIVKYDAIDLQETLQRDLVNVLYEENCPGIQPGKFEFEVDSPNAAELMEYASMLFEWGVPITEEQAYKISQWSKPKSGEGIITKMGAMQPAVGGAPQEVPSVGAGGPQGSPQGGVEAPPGSIQDVSTLLHQLPPNLQKAVMEYLQTTPQGQGQPGQPGQPAQMRRRRKHFLANGK